MVAAVLQSLLPVPKKTGRRLILVGLLAIQATTALAGEIYKFVEEDGTVTYSDLRPRGHPYKQFIPSCLASYIGCYLSHADWSRVPLNYSAYRLQIDTVARKYGVDPALVRAMVHAESNFNQMARSRVGAQGLMQLMPSVQQKFGINNPYDVLQNLNGGTALVKSLLNKYRYDIKLVAAAYNAGEDAVERYKGVPPYEETRNYVRRVTILYSRYRN